MNYHIINDRTSLPASGTGAIFFTTDRTVGRDPKLLCPLLHLGASDYLRPHQTHTDNVLRITEEIIALPEAEREAMLEGVDAVISDVKGICLGVSTADCIPVLVYDSEHNAAAAIHAGWKGTVQRIVENAIALMTECYGTVPSQCQAVIGPGISQESFEVGWEVHQRFLDAGFPMEEFTITMPDRKDPSATKPHLDLKAINRSQLINCGVKVENISVSPIDTFTDERFFSARREQKSVTEKCGRIFSGFVL